MTLGKEKDFGNDWPSSKVPGIHRANYNTFLPPQETLGWCFLSYAVKSWCMKARLRWSCMTTWSATAGHSMGVIISFWYRGTTIKAAMAMIMLFGCCPIFWLPISCMTSFWSKLLPVTAVIQGIHLSQSFPVRILSNAGLQFLKQWINNFLMLYLISNTTGKMAVFYPSHGFHCIARILPSRSVLMNCCSWFDPENTHWLQFDYAVFPFYHLFKEE